MNGTTADRTIQHSGRGHAALGPSSSERWLKCTPSEWASRGIADKPSVYAEEGTFLHELCELKLHRYLGDMSEEVIERQYADHRDNDFYSDEVEAVTDVYVNHCIEVIEAIRLSCPDPYIAVEQRLDFSEYVPGGFGTGDFVAVADGMIEVIDFKGGRGVRVNADHNSQLMLYGLGALLQYDHLYDIHTVRMTIVQPRLQNISSFEMNADELIRWAEEYVRPRAQMAAKGEGEYVAGDHCRWCKIRFNCRARSEFYMALARHDFRQPSLLTDEEIADMLPVAESLQRWVQDLISYVTQQAIQGKQWTGYKLVAGVSRRKYTSEAEVIKACNDAGYTDIYKTSLLSVAELEKRMGKKAFRDVLGALVIKPRGEPSLVPESDPREAINYAADTADNYAPGAEFDEVAVPAGESRGAPVGSTAASN